MAENKAVPTAGDEVRVKTRPSIRSDAQWLQFGKLLTVRHEEIGLIVGSIECMRTKSAEDLEGAPSDDRWTGCIVAAIHNQYDGPWRSTCPISDRAKQVWADVWDELNTAGNG